MNHNHRSNRLLLNYYDACIYESDLNLLKNSREWLNSACIHFFMMRLQHSNAATTPGADIFLDPSALSFLMHHCQENDDMMDFCRGQGLTGTEDRVHSRRIFVPVNDTFGRGSGQYAGDGGMHWSLLVMLQMVINGPLHDSDNFSCEHYNDTGNSAVFMHFDSSSGMNADAAVSVAKKLNQAIHCCKWKSGERDMGNGINHVCVTACPTLQQHNGYDCGVYLLAKAEIILEGISVADTLKFRSSSQDVIASHYADLICKSSLADDLNYAKEKRQQIVTDIMDLM